MHDTEIEVEKYIQFTHHSIYLTKDIIFIKWTDQTHTFYSEPLIPPQQHNFITRHAPQNDRVIIYHSHTHHQVIPPR